MSRPPAVIGLFGGPWETGNDARDGAVLGFEDVFRAYRDAARGAAFELVRADISLFRDYRRIRDFLAACDLVYANCGPWAALLLAVRQRENLDVRIIREVRTVGWVGYIWQEEAVAALERPGDLRVFPSRYARDIWESAAPRSADARVYYPLIRQRSTLKGREQSGTLGFFSVLAEDKGFDQLPRVIDQLRQAGHPVQRLILAGDQSDPALYAHTAEQLARMHVDISFRGGLPNAQVRELMGICDCVLFLSVSSIESLGRVMLEAFEQSVPVITADFGAARELVHPAYRIPVVYRDPQHRPSDRAFPVAGLDVDNWSPPTQMNADDCFAHAVQEYRVEAQSPLDILATPPAELPQPALPVAFSYSCPVEACELADRLLQEPDSLRRASTRSLLDLGGTLKQQLLSWDYNPVVAFAPTACRKDSRASVNQ